MGDWNQWGDDNSQPDAGAVSAAAVAAATLQGPAVADLRSRVHKLTEENERLIARQHDDADVIASLRRELEEARASASASAPAESLPPQGDEHHAALVRAELRKAITEVRAEHEASLCGIRSEFESRLAESKQRLSEAQCEVDRLRASQDDRRSSCGTGEGAATGAATPTPGDEGSTRQGWRGGARGAQETSQASSRRDDSAATEVSQSWRVDEAPSAFPVLQDSPVFNTGSSAGGLRWGASSRASPPGDAPAPPPRRAHTAHSERRGSPQGGGRHPTYTTTTATPPTPSTPTAQGPRHHPQPQQQQRDRHPLPDIASPVFGAFGVFEGDTTWGRVSAPTGLASPLQAGQRGLGQHQQQGQHGHAPSKAYVIASPAKSPSRSISPVPPPDGVVVSPWPDMSGGGLHQQHQQQQPQAAAPERRLPQLSMPSLAGWGGPAAVHHRSRAGALTPTQGGVEQGGAAPPSPREERGRPRARGGGGLLETHSASGSAEPPVVLRGGGNSPRRRGERAGGGGGGGGASSQPPPVRRGVVDGGGRVHTRSPPPGFTPPENSVRGARVTRNMKAWKWGDQDGGPGTLGTALSEEDGWVTVLWDKTGRKNSYRWGHMGVYDVTLVSQVHGNPVIPVSPVVTQGRNPALGRVAESPGRTGSRASGTSVTSETSTRKSEKPERGGSAGGSTSIFPPTML